MASISSVSEDLRMVLLGNPGVGKSATANAILGKEIFKERETTECEVQKGTVDGRNISIIDTPGINNKDHVKTEMKRLLSLSSPGPHVFLLVVRAGGFTEEERNALQWIQENFGEEALKFTMALFIGKEDMTSRQLMNFSQAAKSCESVSKCGFGYCVINSKREVNPAQVKKLLEKIATMVQQNRVEYYTHEMYEEVQRQLLQEKVGEDKKEKEKEKDEKKRREEDKTERANDGREETQTEEVLTELALKKSMGDDHPPSRENNLEGFKREENTDVVSQTDTMRSEDEKEEKETEKEMTGKSQEGSLMMEDQSITEACRRKASGSLKQLEEVRGATGGMVPDPVSDLRIVLLGTARAGKSASGNTFFGREVFGKNFFNGTTSCCRQDGVLGEKTVTVIDTRGISLSAGKSAHCKLFEECLSVSSPGPHVFLLVVHSPRALNNTIYPFIKNSGREFLQHALVLLTHGDIWSRNHKGVLNLNGELKLLVNICGGTYQIFNNKETDRTQVKELLEKIEALVKRNGGKHYTKEMYQEAQRKRMKTKIKERVEALEEKVDVLSLQNKQITAELRQRQSNRSNEDGCCLL